MVLSHDALMDITYPSRTNDAWTDDTLDLYRGHYDSLVRLADRRLNDHGLAEQVVQDVFTRFGQGVSIEPGKELAYLRTMVRNASIELIRTAVRHRSKRHLLADHPANGSSDVSGRVADAGAVSDALAALSPQQRRVLSARYLLDLSVKETAGALNMSVGTVKVHTHRALQRLRAAAQPQTVAA